MLRASVVGELLASLLGVLPLASLVRVSVLRASLVRVTVGVLRASLVGPGVLRRRASLGTVCRCWPGRNLTFARLSRFKFSAGFAEVVRIGVLRASSSLVCVLLASLVGVLLASSLLVRVSVLRASQVRRASESFASGPCGHRPAAAATDRDSRHHPSHESACHRAILAGPAQDSDGALRARAPSCAGPTRK